MPLQLWETKTRFYIIASNQADSQHRVLKIDRTLAATSDDLGLIEDAAVYTKSQINDMLKMIEDGNKASGGLTCAIPLFYGIVGFTRFTAGWYLVLIRRRAPVALIGGHYIFHCEEVVIVPVDLKPVRTTEELKLLQAFQQVDLSKNFYFSHTYDITNTLQRNLSQAPGKKAAWDVYNKFIWNSHLLHKVAPALKDPMYWMLPIIHGFVDQAKLSIYGRMVYITLIARRSRYFAGARFLKRGVNPQGYVANDVETEQIVSDVITTPFFSPPPRSDGMSGERCITNPRYTSHVQHRGSIPVYWTQDAAGMQAKPPIDLSFRDPFYSAAALHFDDLFSRYGTPIIVLNLVKAKERVPRESKLLNEYIDCINYLNRSLPDASRIRYIGFDIANANKKRQVDVIARLEDDAQQILETTSFFHSGPHPISYKDIKDASLPAYRAEPSLQRGVCRTNCIDCLDRTNAAQFIIGRAALGRQLYALGILRDAVVPFDSDAANLLTEMYHDHGDTIALQYGGSNLVNTIESYKIKQWSSHSRDMIEGIKRYYANSFSDADKQKAINLFLGINETETMSIPSQPGRPYIHWYTDRYLQEQHLPCADSATTSQSIREEYWTDYYRPRLFTEFGRHFAFKVNSTTRYTQHIQYDNDPTSRSPFLPRLPLHSHTRDSKNLPNRQQIVAKQWMQGKRTAPAERVSRLQSSPERREPTTAKTGNTNNTEVLACRLLQPMVSSALAEEYEHYVNQTVFVSDEDTEIYANSMSMATPPPSKQSLKIFVDTSDLATITALQLQSLFVH